MADDTVASPAVTARTPASGRTFRGDARGGRRGGPPRRRKVCRFCVDQVGWIDYKQVQVLRSFVTDRGRILSSRISGNCAKHQRGLAEAIERARHLALLSFVSN
ncbi:MAG: 30S ribosomal protein S18 [Elusimicrobia bacterium]|nr:30S ribosomal protein S18 [Elusimicrobiota bacterium]